MGNAFQWGPGAVAHLCKQSHPSCDLCPSIKHLRAHAEPPHQRHAHFPHLLCRCHHSLSTTTSNLHFLSQMTMTRLCPISKSEAKSAFMQTVPL